MPMFTSLVQPIHCHFSAKRPIPGADKSYDLFHKLGVLYLKEGFGAHVLHS